MMTNRPIDLAVQFLKQRVKREHTNFVGHEAEKNLIEELITQTAEHGESNSALVIGPIGCGKTTVSHKHLSKCYGISIIL